MQVMTDPFRYVRQAVQSLMKIDVAYRANCVEMLLKVLEQAEAEEVRVRDETAEVVREKVDSLNENTSPPAQDTNGAQVPFG